MLTAAQNHITIDEKGTAWIDGANTKVIQVAGEWVAHRISAEEMHLWHPHLSLAQIHAAMAYYYDHQAEFDAEIERSYQEYEELRAQAQSSPFMEKLRRLGHLR